MSQQYFSSSKQKGKQPSNVQDDGAYEWHESNAKSRDIEGYRAEHTDRYADDAEAKQLAEMLDRQAALAIAAAEAEDSDSNTTQSARSLGGSGTFSSITSNGLLHGSSSSAGPSTASDHSILGGGIASGDMMMNMQRTLSGSEIEERLFMDKRNRLLKYIQETQMLLEEWREANQEKMIVAFPYNNTNPMGNRGGASFRGNSMSPASGMSSSYSPGFGVRRSRSTRPEMDYMSSSLSALPTISSEAHPSQQEGSSMYSSVQELFGWRDSASSNSTSQMMTPPNHLDVNDRLTPHRYATGGRNGGSASRIPRRASDFAGANRVDPMSLSVPSIITERPPLSASNGSLIQQRRGSGDSLAIPSDQPTESEPAAAPQEMLRVLQLDIKLNLMATPGRGGATLEPGSLAPLFEDRLTSTLRHLANLFERVSDTSFKVIVAGDVNAGKSSVVNALLRRTVVPVDQQPLTSTFLEVLDARLNDDVEEAHACEDRRIYDRLNESTFWRIALRDLEETVAEWTGDEHSIIKVYARQADDNSALVHNDGVANLSVIDSPGLNTDSIKTFFLLARQEEIDVVVFVLNAENTLTLSGREFLEQASKEKAHLFFIVNRFEGIRAKDRCARRILDQIREVSPKTYDEASDLVHWISPTRVRLGDHGNGGDHDDSDGSDSEHGDNGNGNGRGAAPDDWKNMERALRNFTLGRRARTKLEPAKIYLLNILSDLRLLARMNRRDADQRLKQASDALEASRPGYEKLVESQRDDCTTADKETEATGDHIRQLTRRRLRTISESFEVHGGDPVWPGFTGMLTYVNAIRNAMIRSWVHEVSRCEHAALERVKQGSERISTLGMDILTEPARTADLSRLFTKHNEADQLNVRIEIWDLVEIRERIGIATAGLGSMAMIMSNIFGYKSLLLNAAQVGSSVGLQGAKRWFLFSATLAGIGAAAFVIGDMQYAVHRKVARKIRQHIQDVGVIDQHADRIAKRAQAALRFSAQDLRERYQRAVEMERHQREQRAQDQLDAKERRRWFRDMARRAKELQELVDVVDCDDRKVPLTS